ncbi:MAG: hypothetical protein M3P40_12580 [Actinomycetota bacterium]|nr:hypothetical protein [Actinomycetota bacterium]
MSDDRADRGGAAERRDGARGLASAWRGLYGAGPLHLLAMVCSFTVIAAALARFVDAGSATLNLLLWFAGAILVHDFVFLPLYSLLDRALSIGSRRLPGPEPRAVNHLRVPALLSGLLALIYFPLIFRLSGDRFESATDMSADVYLGRWLALTAGLFVASALVFAVRASRRRR